LYVEAILIYEENQKWEQFMRMMMILFCHLHDIFDADGVCDLAMMARLSNIFGQLVQ